MKQNEEVIAKARAMLAGGQTRSAIAEALNVTRTTLNAWLSAEPTQESKPVVEPVSAAQEPAPAPAPAPAPVPVPATVAPSQAQPAMLDTNAVQPADDRPRCEPYHIEAVSGGGRIECSVPGLKLVDFYR